MSTLCGWEVALFGGACLLVGVAEIVSRGDHPGCGASPRLDSVVVGDVMRFGTNQIVWYDDAAVGMLVPSGPAGGSWVLTNADHVVALVVCLGLLCRRTVQLRHFGLPTHNYGALVCEYIVRLGGRSFWWCLLACWGCRNRCSRDHLGGGASLRCDSVLVVVVFVVM